MKIGIRIGRRVLHARRGLAAAALAALLGRRAVIVDVHRRGIRLADGVHERLILWARTLTLLPASAARVGGANGRRRREPRRLRLPRLRLPCLLLPCLPLDLKQRDPLRLLLRGLELGGGRARVVLPVRLDRTPSLLQVGLTLNLLLLLLLLLPVLLLLLVLLVLLLLVDSPHLIPGHPLLGLLTRVALRVRVHIAEPLFG